MSGPLGEGVDLIFHVHGLFADIWAYMDSVVGELKAAMDVNHKLHVRNVELESTVRVLREAADVVLEARAKAAYEEGFRAGAEHKGEALARVGTPLPVRTNAEGEEPFPETVVHAHLDGAMRRYIPVDGAELAGMLAKAEREGFERAVKAAQKLCFDEVTDRVHDVVTRIRRDLTLVSELAQVDVLLVRLLESKGRSAEELVNKEGEH